MKRPRGIRQAVLLGITLATAGGVAFAAAPAGGSTSKASDSAVKRTLNGEIVAIHADKNEVLVKQTYGTDKSESTFEVSGQTTIKEKGKVMHLADLKVGEKISVHYEMVGGKSIAHEIDVI